MLTPINYLEVLKTVNVVDLNGNQPLTVQGAKRDFSTVYCRETFLLRLVVLLWVNTNFALEHGHMTRLAVLANDGGSVLILLPR